MSLVKTIGGILLLFFITMYVLMSVITTTYLLVLKAECEEVYNVNYCSMSDSVYVPKR